MSGQKAALKAIAAAIKAQKYDDVVDDAQKLLANDPKSYQASLFLGFAQYKLSRYAEAEEAYEAATKIRDYDPQAWQGLIQLYEQQGGEKVGAYQKAALNLAEIYQVSDDKYKCQDVVDKFLGFAKGQGTRLQYKQAMEIILPTSPIYDYLDGRVFHPSQSYQIMAQITEFDEKERINKDIGERRTRLGAKIGQVTIDVKREVLKFSDLEYLYTQIVDWSTDDEIRRQYEEKLLQRCLEVLTILTPGKERDEKRSQTFKLATDMVIIKHPYKLAWDIAIEWRDPEMIRQLDVNVLRDYCSFFPTAGLSHVLRGYLASEVSPFAAPPPPIQKVPASADPDESEDDDDGGGGVVLDGPLNAEDRLMVMIDGMSDAPKSILAHRLMGEYYQFLEEHESLVSLMRNGRRLIQEEFNNTGSSFDNSSEAVNAMLGTALVFYQSPKNHPEAKKLFNEILRKNSTSTPALIGIGLIYEDNEDYDSAIDFLERALQRDPSNIRVKTEAAWVKALNGDYTQGRSELELCLSQISGNDVRSKELLAQTQYRIGICLWNMDTSKAARKDRQGSYAYFLAALKSNLNFAPAYTSLGIFYADYSKDKKRSRKCFQKAFELSASEVEAAERLANAFAEQGEWGLVEVVAQRVVDSGKIRPSPGSKKKGISWPFAALGVAELNKQEYAKSIVSFQSALRIAPNDYHSWVGLGESYHNLGRYMAATKAFQHAEKFEKQVEQVEPMETWFAKYMLANVKRELGDYDDAIEGYKSVLKDRPSELGVALAMTQALIEGAWHGIERGLFGYAAQRATETIEAALELTANGYDSFNLWRAVGDACSVFSWVQSHILEFPKQTLRKLLQVGEKKEAYDIFSDIDGVGTDIEFADRPDDANENESVGLTGCLHASILAHKRAVFTSAHDVHAQAVAYYNLGWAEHRAHVCLRDGLKKRASKYLKTSVRCFKRAIELEAKNPDFWNALGVVTSELSPKVAQHSFVRSLYLNERSAQTWSNLGVLYLLHDNFELANEAFTRAQSYDPEYAHAWIGQGLLAGDTREARLLFTHASEIGESSSLVTKIQYAQSNFDHMVKGLKNSTIVDLVKPVFSLSQLTAMAPRDLTHQHLSTLFLERINDIADAVSTLSKICDSFEADYEVTESPSSLSKFALAKADLARLQLATGSYAGAIESGETALQLSAEDAGNELSAEARQKCRLSAYLTVGLAHYYLQETTEALEYFLPALEESNGDPDVVCLLAQVRWAIGDEDSKVQAREELFDCVEKHVNHVQSILLLGIITLLSNDAENLEEATESLLELRSRHTTTDLEQARVGEILRAFAALSGRDSEEKVLAEIQTDVFLHPSQPHGWSRLADIDGDQYAADMALNTALKAVPPSWELDAQDLSMAYAGTEKINVAQVAVMFAPWGNHGWNVLSGDGVAN